MLRILILSSLSSLESITSSIMERGFCPYPKVVAPRLTFTLRIAVGVSCRHPVSGSWFSGTHSISVFTPKSLHWSSHIEADIFLEKLPWCVNLSGSDDNISFLEHLMPFPSFPRVVSGKKTRGRLTGACPVSTVQSGVLLDLVDKNATESGNSFEAAV